MFKIKMFKISTVASSIFFTTLLLNSVVAHAFTTVTLKNVTSCQVTILPDQSVQNKAVLGVDIFSFYYKSDDVNSRTYYSTIPADSAGDAAIGDFTPGITPDMPSLNMGFSPSPGYTTGSFTYVSSNPDTFNNLYVYQLLDQRYEAAYCAHGPCLYTAYTNPCTTTSKYKLPPIK